MLFKNPVRTSKRTPHFTITNINRFIRAMMEAERTSETSVDNYFTWQYIPEDKSELHVKSRLASFSREHV
jgi:hypothetical protein